MSYDNKVAFRHIKDKKKKSIFISGGGVCVKEETETLFLKL
jgi:Ethanolamine utilization protein EutJ (predicted chaperonin)